MHPIWFMAWACERATSEAGLVPLLERNQGTLSLVALALALWAFIAETKRANHEAAAATEADRQRKADALQAESDRRRYEEEGRQQADAARRREEDNRELAQMALFTQTVNGVIRDVENAIQGDREIIAGAPGLEIAAPTPLLKVHARVAVGSLEAILPSAPLNPRLIVDVRRAMLNLETIRDFNSESSRKESLVALAVFENRLVQDRATIAEHNIALTAALRPDIVMAAAALNATPPAEPPQV